MSWLDGMVDEGEVASQDQRLDRTTERLAPGAFTGALSTIGPGLLRGAIEAGRTVQTTALQLGSAAIESDLSMGSSYFPDFEDGQVQAQREFGEGEAQRIGEETARSVMDLRPDPTEVGMVGQILGEAAAVLPRTVIGAVTAGPVGAAVAAGAPAGYSGKRIAMAEGIDENTATLMGVTQGLVTSVGAVIPAARFTSNIFADFGIAAGANIGLGMANRGAMAAVLESSGYHAQAAQYRVLDKTAILTDGLMAAGFFAVGRGTFRRPTTEHIDAALTERTIQHADIDTAPGAPINPRSAVAHQDALRTAIDQLQRGEPVVLPESIHSAQFLRTAEESSVVAPSRDVALATARQDLEPTVRMELEQEAAGILPNVRDVKAELSDIGRTLDALDDTFRARAKEFQQQGQGRKRAEQSARRAIEAERLELTDRQASLNDALGGNRNAELARADLAALNRGETPQRLQDRVEKRADTIAKGFEKNPLAAGVAEGNTKLTMAQIARQEITRILNDIEQAEPTLQAKPLEIGAPRQASKPDAVAEGAKPETDAGKPATDAQETASASGKTVTDPEVAVADEILARVDDMRLPTGATDADGNPVTISARELLAQADTEIQAAQQDARGFAAAAACFLQRGDM